jgi:hypothetical protein
VHGLPRYAKRLSNLRPRPPVAQGLLDCGILKSVGKFAEGDDGREAIGRAIEGAR